MPTDPDQQAKDICLTLLAVRPRTRQELYDRLLRKEIEPEVADRVLGRLDEVGLVDDAAFAELWVRSRHNYQGLSRRALVSELRRKGVDDALAVEAASAVDDEAEAERARQIVRKRMRVTTELEEATRLRRLVGVLARKGYSEGMAYRVVRDELRQAGEETTLLDEAGRG